MALLLSAAVDAVDGQGVGRVQCLPRLVEVYFEVVGCLLEVLVLDRGRSMLSNLCGDLLEQEFLEDVVERYFAN